MLTDSKLQGQVPPAPADAPPGAIVSPDTHRANRLPPGQSRTKKWPVLDAGVTPEPIASDDWALTIGGLVDTPRTVTWCQWQELPRSLVFADMHCVTRWSRLGNSWEGVATRAIADLVQIAPAARFVRVLARDEPANYFGRSAPWSTSVTLLHFLAEDCLFADRHDGEPLSLEHGAPVRLVIPRLYAWKSAKWVAGIEFLAEDAPGYWERGGYHSVGDPWSEQRFRFRGDE